VAELIGRHVELSAFRRILTSEQLVMVVNVTGMAGIGKSTLVEEFAKIAQDNDAHAVVVNARTIAADPNLQAYPPAVQVLSSIARSLRSQRHELRGFTRRINRYTNLYWEVWNRFEGDERQAVSTMLQVGAAAVRAGSTVLPVAKPLDAILTPELTTRLAKAIGGYRRKADRQLLTEPVQQLSEAFVRGINSLTGGSRRLVIVLDEFELASLQTERWLRMLVAGQYGEFEGGLLLVVAGRRQLGHDWTARGNAIEVEHLPLDSFTEVETSEYLEHKLPNLGRRRAEDLGASLGQIYRVPLVLRLLTSRPGFLDDLDDTTGGAVSPRLADIAETGLVHRLLDDALIDKHQRAVALPLSIPRTFNARILAMLAPDAAEDAIDIIESLTSNGFVNTNAPRYTYYELLRTALLRYLKSMDADLVADLHRRLADYHEAQLNGGAVDENQARTVAVEIAYHRLSASSGMLLAEALQLLFDHLPTAYEDCAWWARALVQVADERPEMAIHVPALRRLAAVLLGTHSLTIPDESAARRDVVDPAVNMLFASTFDDSWPTVSDRDAEIWLTYFESRLRIISGNADDVTTALTELNRCWAELDHMQLSGERRTHLFFRLATELADIHTRKGDLVKALHFSRVAMRAARADNSPAREAFALYKLSNNLK
jgi:energy-coupling factor transporter ATP-binding protein EcfA2